MEVIIKNKIMFIFCFFKSYRNCYNFELFLFLLFLIVIEHSLELNLAFIINYAYLEIRLPHSFLIDYYLFYLPQPRSLGFQKSENL